jgi:hypothetical protein
MFNAIPRIRSSIIFCVILSLAACQSVAGHRCETPIGEFGLRLELANSPYFSNGVPGPGRVMRAERYGCGYKVHVGTDSADDFSASTIIVDAKGKILQIIDGY